MENISVLKVKELEAAAKQLVQRLLGRKLQDEEEVAVMAFPPHPAPPQDARQQAARRMDEVLDTSAANLTDVSDSDFEAAADEAMEQQRRRKT